MRRCSKCDTTVHGDERFCPICGTILEASSSLKMSTGFKNASELSADDPLGGGSRGGDFSGSATSSGSAVSYGATSSGSTVSYGTTSSGSDVSYGTTSGYGTTSDDSFGGASGYGYEAPKKKSKAWIVITAIVLVLVIGLGVGAYFLFFRGAHSSPKQLMKAYANFLEDQDADYSDQMEFYDPVTQEKIGDMLSQSGMSEASLTEQIRNQRKQTTETYGKYKVKSRIVYETELTGSEAEMVEKYYTDNGYKLQKTKEIEAEMTLKHSGGEEVESIILTVVKIKGKWYVHGGNMAI